MTRHVTIDDLGAIEVPEQPTLSPDATRVCYVLRGADLDRDQNTRSLWCVDLSSGQVRRLTNGSRDSAPAWSPSGERLAFLRSVEGKPAQVWLLDEDGSVSQLCDLPLGAGVPAWAPDGSRIAFTALVAATASDSETAPSRSANAPLVVKRLDYLVDGEGLTRGRQRHLHVADVQSGACRQITTGAWSAGQPAWSPDGQSIAFSAAMDPDADLTRRSAAYILAADGHGEPQLIGSASGWVGPVAWSADASALVVAGRPAPNGQIRLLRVEIADGTATDLTRLLDRNVMFGSPGYPGAAPCALPDGSVLFCARDRGCTHLYRVDRAGETPTPVVAGAARNVSSLSVVNGRAVFVLSTSSSYGDIASVDLATSEERVHTQHGLDLRGLELYPRQEREFVVADGGKVHGWLIRDPSTRGAGPLLIDIHGGPHNAWNGAADEVHLYHQELVQRGWTVLLVNPRGSDGYGEEWFEAVFAGWGVADARDFLDPLDALVGEGTADPARIAVAGYSYGGYMTCYLTSHHPVFAAAIPGGLISDMTSMAGTADNRRALSESEFGGRPWENRPRYRQMSPLEEVERVTAPTLILHGENDVRCPFGQAQQWHTALRELDVPTEMVLYPGASHTFIIDGLPSHRLDYNRRIVDWLVRHVP